MVDIYMHRDLNQKEAIFMLFKVLILIFLTVRGHTDTTSSISNQNDRFWSMDVHRGRLIESRPRWKVQKVALDFGITIWEIVLVH